MDYQGPPGGFEALFAQYDAIVSHHHLEHPKSVEDEPPWASHEPVPDEAKSQAEPVIQDAPVSKAAPALQIPENEAQSSLSASPGFSLKDHAEGVLKKNLGYDPMKSWRDIDAERMEAAEKRMNADFKNPNGASFQQDEEGLTKAYNNETAPGVFYDPDTRTEYIKGSTTARDWWDDASKIPFWGDTRDAERYQQADKAYEDLVLSGKPVDRVVGHSLGGSVALQMQKDRFIPKSRTFGAPVVDLNAFGTSDRYRHPLDPVSVLDRGATWGKFKPYSHSYTGFENLQKNETK